MLRLIRNKNRPLLHVVWAWSVVAPHLVEVLASTPFHIQQSAISRIDHWSRNDLLKVSHCLQAACHTERHVSQKAVSFIHDVLTEVLTSWVELPHFHFNEALFRPFEHIMQLEICDEDVQDQVTSQVNVPIHGTVEALMQIYRLQVVTSIGELVEMCSPQILSGWRPLFSALRTVHSSKSDTKDYLLGEYSMGTGAGTVQV